MLGISLLSQVLAGFTVPMDIANDAWSFLYLVPLALMLSLVYKTTKIPVFSLRLLLRETLVLAASILVFMAIVAAALYFFCALVLQ